MRTAVGLSYVVAALMILPVGVIAIGAFLTGDVTNHQVDSSLLAATPETYGDTGTSFHQFAVVMVWLYIIGQSTYGVEAAATFAPEFQDEERHRATMDGSRRLYALARGKMTIRQLGVLNRFRVPARAMTVGLVLNVFLRLHGLDRLPLERRPLRPLGEASRDAHGLARLPGTRRRRLRHRRRQWGRPFRLQDPSDESPSAEATDAAQASTPERDGWRRSG